MITVLDFIVSNIWEGHAFAYGKLTSITFRVCSLQIKVFHIPIFNFSGGMG